VEAIYEGEHLDVTEGVRALYDHCVGSMDWGSGFLTLEDATEILRVAQTCGFLVPVEAREAFETYAVSAGQALCAVCRGTIRPSYPGWHHSENDPSLPHLRRPIRVDKGHPAALFVPEELGS
jgi:hypothetical protein